MFGSVLNDSFNDQNDSDILFEFQEGKTASLMKMAAMEEEFSGHFGRKVDLRTPAELSRYFRSDVV